MSNNPYQVLGTGVPSMLGRANLLREAERYLFQTSPAHIQVVGPRQYGKSVFLSHLAARIRLGNTPYITAAYDDLRHATPLSDHSFKSRFALLIKGALSAQRPDIADFINPDDEHVSELLELALTELEIRDERILVILDGFDHVMIGTGLTSNLLHQLRALAQRNSLRLVTGSRRPLRELCRTEDSLASDFWEIFLQNPLFINRVHDSDWDDFIKPLERSGRSIDPETRVDLISWSGGVPLLVTTLLSTIFEESEQGVKVTKSHVSAAAERVFKEGRQLIADLWEDCPTEIREDLSILATDGIIAIDDVPLGRREDLEARGLAKKVGPHLQSACHLLKKYANQQAVGLGNLKRLFGTPDQYNSNVRSMLELRLSQATAYDTELHAVISKSIRDLEPDPSLALTWVRRISERALHLIWKKELGPSLVFPNEWIDDWKQAGESPRSIDSTRRLPRSSGAQCSILRLATGTDKAHSHTRYATKLTQILVDGLQTIGDFGQHIKDYPEGRVTMDFAASAIIAAIDLLNRLSIELNSPPRQKQ